MYKYDSEVARITKMEKCPRCPMAVEKDQNYCGGCGYKLQHTPIKIVLYTVLTLPLWFLVEAIYRIKYKSKWWDEFDKYESGNRSLGFILKRATWDILVNEDSFWNNLKWRLRERFDDEFYIRNEQLKNYRA